MLFLYIINMTLNVVKYTREEKCMKKIQINLKNKSGVTLIALIITIIVSYDKMKKYSNINSFLFSKN